MSPAGAIAASVSEMESLAGGDLDARTPPEKTTLLRLLGVELLEVEDELCPLFPTEGARGVVKSLVESEAYNGRYVSPNQYENQLNVEAHYRTTGPEIWNQTGGEVDYFFAAFGTCGTITGVGRYLKERKPGVKIIGIEPAQRQHRLSGCKKISNLPEEHRPKILDYSLLDDIVAVEDHEAFDAAIDLARSDGLMVGPTTGALLHAARKLGADARGTAVVISPAPRVMTPLTGSLPLATRSRLSGWSRRISWADHR